MSELTEEQEILGAGLTKLQRLTAIHYASGTMSQREAYRAAGGRAKTDNTADASVSEILCNPKVKAFYESLIKQVESDSIMSREECLERLTRIGRSSVKDLATFRRVQVGDDENGDPVYQSVWEFKNDGELTEEQAELIHELSATRSGIKLRMHSAPEAIKTIAAMQGYEAPKKIEHGGLIGNVDLSIDSATDPQKASEVYMDVMRGISQDN